MLLPTVVLKIAGAGAAMLSKGLHTSGTSLQAKQRVTKPAGFWRGLRKILFLHLRALSLWTASDFCGCAVLLLGLLSVQEGRSAPKRSKVDEITRFL